MTFDELLADLLPLVGRRIDATVFAHVDGGPELVATVTGTLRRAVPVARDSEAEETEVMHLAPPTPAMWAVILGMSIAPLIMTQTITLTVMALRRGHEV